MAKANGINVPIYKIDLEAVTDQFGTHDVNAVPALLIKQYNLDKDEEVYKLVGQAIINGAPFSLYLNVAARPNTIGWFSFFEGTDLAIENLKTQMQHLVCFVVVDEELFAYTAGQAAVVFERYTDIYFPIAVGRRIAKPEVKGARANQITGSTLANDMHFRDSRRITHTESLDTVWTSLSGAIRDEIVSATAITEIFGNKSKISMTVSGAIRLGPKIESPAKILKLMKWLSTMEEAALPDDDGWASLDTIKILNPRRKKNLIRELRTALGQQLFVDNRYDNLAVSHTDVALWASATNYSVSQGDVELYEGAAPPLLEDFVRAADVDPGDIESTFASIKVEAMNDEYGPSAGTSGPLLNHLHGELRYKQKTYFLLGGKWYEVDKKYIDEVSRDFVGILDTIKLPIEEIGLRSWKQGEREDSYNSTSLPAGTFINGDKILMQNVELFDTIEYGGEVLRILHVKQGFNVKIRDVRSQLVSSVQIIENDLRGGGDQLKAHHRQLVAKGRTTLSEAEFMLLFERPRVYVLAYGAKIEVTRDNYETSVQSSVARMELVSLNSQFRQVSNADSQARLSLTWIPVI